MSDELGKLQDDIAARLSADSYFADVTVLTERQGDLSNKIDRALKVLTSKDSKIGVAVLVGVITADVSKPNAPGPYFDDATIEVTAFENVMFNNGASGTAKPAVAIAIRAVKVLHHYYAGGLGQALVADREAIRPLGEVQPGTIAYRAKIRFPVNTEILSKVVTPAISPTSGAVPQTVTLTCATSGAAIYYTTDESYPWSGNAQATLYSAPFSIATAGILRVVAHKTGYVASDAAWAQFT